MKRAAIVLGILLFVAVIAAAGWMGYRSASGGLGPMVAPTPGPAPKTVTVERGDVRQVLVVPGEIVPVTQRKLALPVGGRLAEVAVQPGDAVQAGQVLARLETGPLEQAVLQAEIEVEVKRAALEKLTAGTSAADVTTAQQNLRQAQTDLSVNRQSRATAVETARLSWETAANALRNAQDEYSRLYWEQQGLLQRGVELTQAQKDAAAAAWRQVQDADAAMEKARLSYELAVKEESAGATNDRAQVSKAQAQLDALLAGPNAQDIIQAEAALRLAEMALETEHANLAAAVLSAPFDGTVLAVNAQAGEHIAADAPLVEVATLQEVQLRTTVGQEEVMAVQPGQRVEVILDALPDERYVGRVERIVPRNVGSQIVKYEVYVSLEEPPAGLLPGMTADVEIVTAERQDVLVLPRRTVRARADSTVEVPVLEMGQVITRSVQIGLLGDLNMEVLAGLEEGDQVVVKR